MPEGDTVWLAGQRLRAALAGQRLLATDFRVPALAATDLTGQTVLAVEPRGKHLLTRFSGGWTMHTHFRMDGSWHLYRPGQRWGGGPDWQVRAVLRVPEHVAVGYRLPVLEMVPTAQEDRVVGHLGPDLCADVCDTAAAVAHLRADPGSEIGLALLDQRKLAGLGNLYRTEVCFLRGLSPWTPVGAVADLAAVVDCGRRLLLANRGHWEQSTTGSLGRGEDKWVFERAGQPCRRCGTRIRTAEQGDPPRARISYWCPHCQPGPAPAGSTRRPPPATLTRGPRYRN